MLYTARPLPGDEFEGSRLGKVDEIQDKPEICERIT